ncbi:sensor histidine kinase [Altererythrobacter confluentis]|uniref:histidine kinase n=1 Tax=Allopontixanthobacter confluentis TaxID=1849021 RepID=A0A6L7GFG7_9SPHN|nr:HAMP domain-containing sensor histidine kinase [Allopontixanthobacter confluentis]MXP14206.1 sensor histidine kinase [Allopontixanthobacter confluentis]
MNAATTSYLARARTDADDCLIEADEPLAGLQLRCGGTLPGKIAIPELLALVRKTRKYGLRLARMVHAIDGDELIKAWVEISPHAEGAVTGADSAGQGGCTIHLANWQTSPLPGDDQELAASRQLEIDRAIAELTSRLDPRQHVLTVESTAPDLAELVQRMRSGMGRPWTDFVVFPGNSHEQPMHWRLLDGAECIIEGSERKWKAVLVPLGQPEAGSAGFELYLVAQTPFIAGTGPRLARGEPVLGNSLGSELSPVLRQPIARIIANAETIRSKLAGPLAQEYSDYAADIASAGQHLLALIDDLSDLEVVESAGFSTAPDRIDVADVAQRAAGILGVRAQERGIELILPTLDAPLGAIAEFRRVLQVLLNLVGNAIRYSPQGSRVRIECAKIGSTVHITVADEGAGLSPDQQIAVFEKFERLGRSGDGGSGLGLYISRRIARAMGGDLTVESSPGEGARFTLEIPGEIPGAE